MAAQMCKVPVRTVRRWAQQGRLRSIQLGRVLWVDPLEVAELADRRAP